MTPRAPSTPSPWIRLLLAAAVLIVFAQTLGHDFVDWDDRALIYGNPNLNPPTLTGLARQWIPSDPNNDGMYDPIVYTLWWLLAHVARTAQPDLLGSTLNPAWFHAANLAVHLLTVLLVFEILQTLRLRPWPSAAGALLFAIHPLQVEPVAWATGMKDLLSGLFAMAAIWRYLLAPDSKCPKSNYAAATLFFILALLCKPSVVTIPFIAAALEVLILRRPWKQSALRLAPWLIFAAAAAFIATKIQSIQFLPDDAWYLRPLIAADALAFYLWKLICPLGLNFDYARTPTLLVTDPTHPLYWMWLIPLAVGGFILWLKRPYLSAAAWVFLLGLLPVLGFVPFIYQFYSTVADRYVYIPVLGAAIAAAWVVQQLSRRPALLACVAVLAILTSLAIAQTARWKNTRILFEYSEQANPDHFNPLHLDVLGRYFDRLSAGRADENLNAAIDCYTRSIQLDPLYPHVYDVLCDELIRAARFDEAIQVGKNLIAIQPRLTEQQREKPAVLEYRLGMLYFRAGHFPEALQQFKLSIQTDPTPDAQKMLQIARDRIAATAPSTRP
jgi:tetratricopeptide (TPR) repeat protein